MTAKANGDPIIGKYPDLDVVDTVEISITEEDIATGRKMDCYGCPGALAIKRVLPRDVAVSVGDTVRLTRWLTETPPDKRSAMPWLYDKLLQDARQAPPLLRSFIRRFDYGYDIEPVTFTLYVPRWFLVRWEDLPRDDI